MQTELFTVSKIFTESLYRIPDYQRGYAWGIDQLKDFWLDLEQLQGDGKHYTGVLTLEVVPKNSWKKWDDDIWIIESRRYKPFYVVDGQQRLTTVILLIQSILEMRPEGELNFTPVNDVRRKYIFDAKQGGAERAYIFGYEKDNPSYEFLKTRIFLEESDVHLPDEVTIYTKQLIAAKNFFKEQLSKLNTVQLEALFTKVTQQLVFNVYEISSDIDVFVTFETMNNRGKALSTLELLKNRLIFLSTRLQNQGRDGVLRRKINDAWKSAYHYLGKNEERPLDDDEFLQRQFAYFFLTNLLPPNGDEESSEDLLARQFPSVMEHYKLYLLNYLFTPKRLGTSISDDDKSLPALTKDFIDKFSQHMKSSVELYFRLSTPSQSDWADGEKVELERIGRLVGHSPSHLLLAIFKRESSTDKRIRFLRQYERFHFFRSFGLRHPVSYAERSYGGDQFVRYATGRYTIDELTTFLENATAEMFRETTLQEHLSDWVKNGHGYYGWHSIKYFLYEYELHLQQMTRSGRQKLDWKDFCKENYRDDYGSIEHIYPQRAKDPYWTQRFSKFTPTQKRLLRNSLGNLLPLSRPRNSSLGNKSFPEKLGDEASMTGYRYGSYSENEVANYPEWGPEEIVRRGIHLLSFLEKRWSLPQTDNKQKLKALGLGFMDK